jgi:CheY-like chemotaxis protein
MPEGGRIVLTLMPNKRSSVSGEEASADFIVLSVSDTGHGMDQGTVDHIFEPFFTTKGKGKGTGLGLATVYGIVKQNDGEIVVRSEPGQGTVFEVRLPSAKRQALPETDRQKDPSETGKGVILLVEDESMVRKLAKKLLSLQGYEVLEAVSGGDACVLCESYEGAIDLLLTDVIMPNMNGRELYSRLEKIKPGLKVLFMSGYTEDIIAHHGVVEEGFTFLQKPFSVEALSSKVQEAISD